MSKAKSPTFEQVKAFLLPCYKPSRLYERGDEYGNCVVSSSLEQVVKTGIGCVSIYESARGVAIWFVFDGKKIKEINSKNARKLLRREA